jgi:hypothetical protein
MGRNLRAKVRVLASAEDIIIPVVGAKGCKIGQDRDLPVLQMDSDEFSTRLSNMQEVMQYGNKIQDKPPQVVTDDAGSNR